MKRRLIRAVLSVMALLLLETCSPVTIHSLWKEYKKLPDENPIEELVEDVIEDITGEKVDISGRSPES